MRLLLEHPRVALRDCQHCLKHQYDEETGEVELDPSAPIDPKTGRPRQEPLLRPAPDPKSAPLGWAPCRLYAAGKKVNPCPKGTPENPKSLSARNLQAYQHYKECRAVGKFPDDPWVRRRASIINEIEEAFERQRRDLSLLQLRADLLAQK